MNNNPLLLPLAAAFVSTITGGGLWFVIRLVIKYQRDFADRYAAKIIEQDATIARRDQEIDNLQRQLVACATERGALRAVVRQNGLSWNPQDYGAIHE